MINNKHLERDKLGRLVWVSDVTYTEPAVKHRPDTCPKKKSLTNMISRGLK